VLRHQACEWRKPEQAVDLPALEQIDRALDKHGGALILDSFCGTGQSSIRFAQAHPDALVIGIDKSAQRLGRSKGTPDNCLLLQAHCEAVWRHLVRRAIRLDAHYLLYPNPWPKPGHLSRRVHGHPAFPLLLELGGRLELRSNWQIYVEEFGVALHLLGQLSRIAVVSDDAPALTLFEQKYRISDHELWSLTATVGKTTQGKTRLQEHASREAGATIGYPIAMMKGQEP
jgi:tRNA G46 methylase TrmB